MVVARPSNVCCIPAGSDAKDRDDGEHSPGAALPSSSSERDDANRGKDACRRLPLRSSAARRRANDGSGGGAMAVRSGLRGLYAIATRDVAAGDVVVQCLPIAHSILAPPGLDGGDGARRRCARCFFREGDAERDGCGVSTRRKDKFGRCSKCARAYYCSRSCQAQDWEEQHKLECQYYVKRRKLGSSYASSAEEDAMPLLLRTFNSLKFIREMPEEGDGNEGDVGADLNIEADMARIEADSIVSCGPSHFSSMIASPKQYKDATAASFDSTVVSLIESFAARGKPMPDRSKKEEARSKTEAALRIWGYNESSERGTGCGTTSQAMRRALSSFALNNFGIVDALHSPIGEGVYPCAALLNHSCYPNCILRYVLGAVDGAKDRYHRPILQIVACRDIVSGEELCHSYVDLALSTRERRARLLDTHGFVCDCARCERGGGCSVDLPANGELWSTWPLHRATGGPTGTSPRLVKVHIDDAMMSSRGLSEADWASIKQRSEMLQQKASECMLCGDSIGELGYLQEAIELHSFRDKGKWLSPFNGELYQLRCTYLSALLANGRVVEGVEQCEHIVSFLAVAFHHVGAHPLLGLQLYTLGDLYSAAASMEESDEVKLKEKAKLAYSWAREVMVITHDERDHMLRALEDNLA